MAKNPFKVGTVYHRYFVIFTKLTAPSDSDVVKEIYKSHGHITTTNTLQIFRYRLKKGHHPEQHGVCVTNIALQPRSCSPKELERWVSENVT